MPRLAKGSEEARQRMAHLRTMRKKKGGSIPEAPIAPPPKEESPKLETTGKGSKKTSWVKHVADFAHKNNLNYFEALKDPKVKEGYTKK
jgi:hypothetical protein